MKVTEPSLSPLQPTIFGTLTNERALFDNRLVSHQLSFNCAMMLAKSGHLGFEGVRVKLLLIETRQVMGNFN